MKKLFLKFQKRECSHEEVQQLIEYIRNSKDLLEVPSVEAIYDILNDYPEMEEEEANRIFDSIVQTKEKKKNVNKKIFYLRKYAAIFILGVLMTSYFFKDSFFEEPQKKETTLLVKKEIAFGSSKAILTLSNGVQIKLKKGKNYTTSHLKSNGDEIVYKGAKETNNDIAYNYLTIPRGGQFTITLSDGTQVWLNSETQLKYPVHFIEGKSRKVVLVYGEAYFDVSHSTEHKGANFEVYHNKQEIEVLGTEFNVKAYKDETNVFTTLVKGKVAIKALNKKEVLVPNEQSIFNTNNTSITINKVDIDNEISWKKGLFSFNNMPLKEIMKVLCRWYDVDIKFKDSKIEKVKFNGVLKRNQSLEEVLTIIQSTNFIKKFKINGKEIIIE